MTAAGFGGQGWTAAGSAIEGMRAGLGLGGGRFGEDGWAAVGSARRWGAGRRQVLATEGWTAADTATAGWAAIGTATAQAGRGGKYGDGGSGGGAKVGFDPQEQAHTTRRQ